MKYRVLTEETYQALLSSAKVLAVQEEGVEAKLADVKEAKVLVNELAAATHPDSLLPPSLPCGTPVIVSSNISADFPDTYTLMMAIQAYPGVVVRLPEGEKHNGYCVWGMVDAYAASRGDRAYKGEWVLKHFADIPGYSGSHFWAYRFTYEEMMKRRADLMLATA